MRQQAPTTHLQVRLFRFFTVFCISSGDIPAAWCGVYQGRRRAVTRPLSTFGRILAFHGCFCYEKMEG